MREEMEVGDEGEDGLRVGALYNRIYKRWKPARGCNEARKGKSYPIC